MDSISYIKLNNTSFNMKWVKYKSDVILYVSKQDFVFWKNQQFDNHNMALMLVEILYSRNQINEATYRKIMRKYHIQNRIA